MTGRKVLSTVFIIFLATAIPMTVVIVSVLVVTDGAHTEPFVSLFNIIQFQISRILLYSTYFVLGILAFRNHWLRRGIFDHTSLWTGLFVVSGALFFSIMNIYRQLIPGDLFGPLFILSITLFIASAMGFAMNRASRSWDYPLGSSGEIASHAFNIYLIHYPFVYLLQLSALELSGVPLFIKFIAVSGLTILLSYLTSKYIITHHAKSLVLWGVVASVVMIILL